MIQIYVSASESVEDLRICELLTYKGPQYLRSILICIRVDEDLHVYELLMYRRNFRHATHR